MDTQNTIRLEYQPGIILELRTATPVPAAGYGHAGRIAEAGAGLSELMAAEEGADETSS